MERANRAMNKTSNRKMIAFYLPQFHTIPENDEWWGEGFTEWTNVRKAKPLFPGHYQPRVPLGEDYYDLLDPEVMRRQARLAQEYGIYGFCYYHYWFKDGKKLLEKPVESMLQDPAVNIPFCLSWANENWSRTWNGSKNDVLMEQDYGREDEWEKHFDYLLPFFRDERYIKLDGKPLFIIYKPHLIPHIGKMLKYMRKRAIECGFEGMVLASQHPTWLLYRRHLNFAFDYNLAFAPALVLYFTKPLLVILKKKIKRTYIEHDYDKAWHFVLQYNKKSKKAIPCAFTGWDNTPRNIRGHIFKGSTPERFAEHLKELSALNTPTDLLFINAWNEWAEGAYLEPDERYGYGYLEGVGSL
jgi:hypothetical protein